MTESYPPPRPDRLMWAAVTAVWFSVAGLLISLALVLAPDIGGGYVQVALAALLSAVVATYVLAR